MEFLLTLPQASNGKSVETNVCFIILLKKEVFFSVPQRKQNCYWFFHDQYGVDWAYCNDESYLMYNGWWYKSDSHHLSPVGFFFFQHADDRERVAFSNGANRQSGKKKSSVFF